MSEIIHILVATLGSLSLFFVPGYAIVSILRLKSQKITEQLLLIFALSTAIIPFVGLLLDYTFGITPISVTTLIAIFFLIAIYARFSHQPFGYGTIRSIWSILFRFINSLKVSSKKVAFSSAFAFVVLLSLLNWRSCIGVHSIDIGIHVYWAKKIQMSSHIPDYTVIERFDEPYKFLFGSHLLLAEFSFATGLPLEDYYWVPLILFSLLTMLGLFVLGEKITGSPFAGIIAAFFFATSFQPGGYIQRGNLPDVVGYFLFISILYVLIRVTNSEYKFSITLGFLSLSVLYFHQYASLILVSTILYFFVYLGLLERKKFVDFLKSTMGTRKLIAFWIIMAVLAVFTSMKLGYVLAQAPKFLGDAEYAVQWRSWVIPLDRYPSQLGNVLFLFGLFGLLTCLFKFRVGELVLLSWVSSLLMLSNAPILGIGVPEPYRFVWRMTETFAVAAGKGCYSLVGILRQIPNINVKIKIVQKTFNFSISRKMRWVPAIGIILLLGTQAIYALRYPRYDVREPYFETDKQVATWLSQNSSPNALTVLNVDVDNTATWVQAFSMSGRFLYKVDAGIGFAPKRYKEVYQDLATLFADPSSVKASEICKKYGISYVVVHDLEIPKFDRSPFFKQIYQVSHAAIYVPVLRDFYGEVKKLSGWMLPTEDGRRILLLTSIEIEIVTINSTKLLIPIYSHVTEPETPNSSLDIFVDGLFHSHVIIPKGNMTNRHLNYKVFWPWLNESGVGEQVLVEIPLEPGTHTISFFYTSDIDFEIYVEDLKKLGIAFNLIVPEPHT
jgi:hypothetical protein